MSLAPLRNPEEVSPQEGLIAGDTRKQMLLPVGELPRLHINAILHNGRLLTHGIDRLDFEVRAERRLNCERSNIRIIERFAQDEQGKLVVPMRSRWSQQLDDPELQGLFVAIGSRNDPYATVIPAIEVFRFFYATSDVLAKAALCDHFLDPDLHLWSVRKTAVTPDGRALIWLRKQMLDADARFLARFAFDNYALQQAQQIFLHASAALQQQGERMIRAVPPFQSVVETRFYCLPIGGPDGERVLVTRLLRCDWKPPWTHLRWDRDNDGRYDPDGRDERDPTDWKPRLLAVNDETNSEPTTLANLPPSIPNVPSRLKEIEIADRFPELAKTPAEKMPQDGSKTRADCKDWRPLIAEAYPGSVIDGKSSGELVGRTIIEGLQQKPEPSKEHTDAVNAAIGDEDYLAVPRLLRVIDDLSLARVEYMTVLDSVTVAYGFKFNVYPREIDGREKVWLYVDQEKAHRRMVLLAQVTFAGRRRYVIELQQRRPGECSTLVAWQSEGFQLPTGILACLVMDCARAEGTTLGSAQLFDVHWARLRHTTKNTDEASARHFLERIFGAMPNIPARQATDDERE